jgi:hypothetical protein
MLYRIHNQDSIMEISNQEIKMMKKTSIFQMTSKYKIIEIMLTYYYQLKPIKENVLISKDIL